MRKFPTGKSRFPSSSIFYDKIVPLLLVGMAIVTVVMIVFAIGVVLGLVAY
jgi:hypothetical protein